MSAKAITAIGLLLCVGVVVAQDKAKKTNEEAKELLAQLGMPFRS